MPDSLFHNSLNSGQFANVQAGQTSHGGPSAGQTKEKGKVKLIKKKY